MTSKTSLVSRQYNIANALRTAAMVFEQDAKNEEALPEHREMFARMYQEAMCISEALEEAEDIIVMGNEAASILDGLKEISHA